jgi:hypothetical protein
MALPFYRFPSSSIATDLYKVLGVGTEATPADLKAAHREAGEEPVLFPAYPSPYLH